MQLEAAGAEAVILVLEVAAANVWWKQALLSLFLLADDFERNPDQIFFLKSNPDKSYLIIFNHYE